MNKVLKLVKYVILMVAFLVMGQQILYGFQWMRANFFAIPGFGDSGEYVALSYTLVVDEYRTIAYPLFLHWMIRICPYIGYPFQSIVYVLQTLVSFISILYLLNAVFGKLFVNMKRAYYWSMLVYMALFLLCIPMITFMNFSVLTDSLATSFMLFSLGAISRVLEKDKKLGLNISVLIISTFLQYLLRADRIYSGTLFYLIILGVYLCKKKSLRNVKIFVYIMIFFLVTTGGSMLVNKVTQQPGIANRISTDLEFIILDRIVWPNMAANYADFPEEIKAVISIEEAREFDSHNNNVMYQLAPLVESRVGHEQASIYYKTMGKIVLKNQFFKVMKDISEDIMCVIFTPMSTLGCYRGYVDKNDMWNLHCVSGVDAELTYRYSYNGLLILSLGMIFAMGWAVISKVIEVIWKVKMKNGLWNIIRTLKPQILMCFIIALWFSIGDGAPPNDRYALLHYITWGIIVLGTLAFSSNPLTEDLENSI